MHIWGRLFCHFYTENNITVAQGADNYQKAHPYSEFGHVMFALSNCDVIYSQQSTYSSKMLTSWDAEKQVALASYFIFHKHSI